MCKDSLHSTAHNAQCNQQQRNIHTSSLSGSYLTGCLATFCALTFGLHSFRKGDRRMSQLMMRARIAAQGFTVVALIIGVGMSLNKSVTAVAETKTIDAVNVNNKSK